MASDELALLREEWSTLYSQTLPNLARAKDPVQDKWPVTLDHCFARIILDNTVGHGKAQWDTVLKRPAVKNMDKKQLKDAIELGTRIQQGEVNLVELDRTSLIARGKADRKYKDSRNVKREREDDSDADGQRAPSKKRTSQKNQSTIKFAKDDVGSTDGSNSKQAAKKSTSSPQSEKTQSEKASSNPNTAQLLTKIQNNDDLTPYRKRLYTTLLSVPAGHHTTYQAMADHLNSSARAIGNGMRNNPYAPDVPCHRVLASDGSIGGFGGSWGEEGKHAQKKRDLLKQEGVRFDSKGKVKGPVFRDFEDFY